ncbi:MAG: hypothetical protein M0Z61_06025 [Nitrospiraceae bacterium]|nr:hypothetical protein [Nitrospiraceae bacterium]
MNGLLTDFRRFARERAMNGSCFIVGGTVRDILMGINKPADIDIAMKGRAVRATQSFARMYGGSFILLDEHFGTARVVRGKEHLDISKMRGKTIGEDLSKRDMTINAMAFPLSSRRLIDPFGGSDDLMKGLVRIVSEENLVQDPLRILRCYRFSATHGFRIEKGSAAALKKLAPLLDKPASERITEELKKILTARSAGRVLDRMLKDGALRMILPGFRSGNLNVFKVLEGQWARFPFGRKLVHAEQDVRFPLRLAALASGAGERAIERIVLSNKERKFLERLSFYRPRIRNFFAKGASGISFIKIFRELGDEIYVHMVFCHAFLKAEDEKTGDEFLDYSRPVLAYYLEKVRPRMGKRPITGEDLKKEFSLKPSPLFKQVLDAVELKWLKREIKNRKQALEEARKLIMS